MMSLQGVIMSAKEYKKTYKPFILWLILFPILFSVPSFLLKHYSGKIQVSVVLFLTMMSLYILMFVIYRGEYVYWINGGPTFKQAKEAGSKVRKQYAKSHLKISGSMFAVGTVYLVGSQILNFNIWIDIIVISVLIIVSAIKTMTIRFNP